MFRKSDRKKSSNNKMTKIEILNADFNMTIDKFMKVMWSNNDFWLQVQKEQGLFDLEFGKTKLKVRITIFSLENRQQGSHQVEGCDDHQRDPGQVDPLHPGPLRPGDRDHYHQGRLWQLHRCRCHQLEQLSLCRGHYY